MIGYVVLGTNDLPRAKSFYDTLLAEMGVSRLMEFGGRGYGWAASMDQPMLCIMTPYDGKPATVGNGVMAGISVGSRDLVDRVQPLAHSRCDAGAFLRRRRGLVGFPAAGLRGLRQKVGLIRCAFRLPFVQHHIERVERVRQRLEIEHEAYAEQHAGMQPKGCDETDRKPVGEGRGNVHYCSSLASMASNSSPAMSDSSDMAYFPNVGRRAGEAGTPTGVY